MRFTDVFVPDEDVLGGVDEGFRYAQVRLGPARMTHVMRWTGAAPPRPRDRRPARRGPAGLRRTARPISG